MFNSYWLTIGMIVFGLVSWILPFINLGKHNTNGYRKGMCLSVVSISACAGSLCLVIFEIKHRVKTEDWSALMDTVPAFSFVSTTLLVVTIVLNVLLLFSIHEK